MNDGVRPCHRIHVDASTSFRDLCIKPSPEPVQRFALDEIDKDECDRQDDIENLSAP